jgi:hypothetical protein
MQNRNGIKVALFTIGLVLSVSGQVKPSSNPAPADLAWMSGDWETTRGTAQVDEHWTQPAGGMLMGMSRTVRDGKTRFFEYLRIEWRPDGIFFVAHPQAGPGADFKLASWNGTELVFVNPGHSDHLKRIIYRKNPDGSLTGHIEGEDGGKPFSLDWNYHRAH